MDNTQNFMCMNQNMNNNQFFMNNQVVLNNNQMFNQNLIQNPMINQYNNPFYNNYMIQNNNNMILNNQMMNMINMYRTITFNNNNQMDQNLMNNNFNNNGLNNDNNINIGNLDNDKLNLINSITEFFKQNNIDCMNFAYPNQIKAILNLLNENFSGFKYENDVKDPLFYIKEPKIIIKFINSNYVVIKVKIPKSITQYDLYTIANLYKWKQRSDILLIHKNKVLKKNESSIDFISDNDNIIIIEPRYFPDDSYYNSLIKKSSNDVRNVRLNLSNGQKLNRIFPSDITIGEIGKAFHLILGSSSYDYFLFNKYKINLNDIRNLKEFSYCDLVISQEIFQEILGTSIHQLGKQLNFKINSDEKTVHNSHFVIGILNKIEDIMIYIEAILRKMVKKIKIGEIEIKKNEDKRLCSLFSLGITKDFDCQIEF